MTGEIRRVPAAKQHVKVVIFLLVSPDHTVYLLRHTQNDPAEDIGPGVIADQRKIPVLFYQWQFCRKYRPARVGFNFNRSVVRV